MLVKAGGGFSNGLEVVLLLLLGFEEIMRVFHRHFRSLGFGLRWAGTAGHVLLVGRSLLLYLYVSLVVDTLGVPCTFYHHPRCEF